MNFSFIHAADIHLDSPLRGLGGYSHELAECFQQASRQAFVNLVDAAISRDVAFMVIAGDIFDGDWKDFKTGLFFVEQMGRLNRKNIPVYAISGNHDAESELSKNLPYPPNVHMFETRKPQTIIDERTGTALHGQGFAERWSTDNIALRYPPPQAGILNVGILHTSCEGSTEHANYAPCKLDQLRNHGYQYWALGHVHGHAILCEDPYVVFSGNLQGRHARETGPKGFCIVEVTDSEVTSLEHVCCDTARWAVIDLNLATSPCSDTNNLMNRLRLCISDVVARAENKPLALRITLTGATPLHTELVRMQESLRESIQSVAFAVSQEVMLEKLRLQTTEPITLTPAEPPQDLLAELIQYLESDASDEAIHAEISALRDLLQTKLPGRENVLPDEGELADLVVEARELLAANLVYGSNNSAD